MQWWKASGALSALVLAACGSASHGATTTVTAAAPPPAGAPAAAAAARATTATAATETPAPVTATGAPLAAAIYGSVNAAAAALVAAPAGLDEAVSRCAAGGDCAAAQAIAAKVRAAETALSVLLLTAGAGAPRGSACQQAITDLSDAVVHRYRGRLDDFLGRTTVANARRLDEALSRVGDVAAGFHTACASAGG